MLDHNPLVCGPLSFHPSTRQLLYGEKEIRLTATEGHILHHLMRNAGRVVTHFSLAEEVWGEDYPGASDSLKVHIRRLREKIEADPSHPQLCVRDCSRVCFSRSRIVDLCSALLYHIVTLDWSADNLVALDFSPIEADRVIAEG
ncbi:MAG: winged helix-turn-helix domain-containing protein [Anaerolineae bacterium]